MGQRHACCHVSSSSLHWPSVYSVHRDRDTLDVLVFREQWPHRVVATPPQTSCYALHYCVLPYCIGGGDTRDHTSLNGRVGGNTSATCHGWSLSLSLSLVTPAGTGPPSSSRVTPLPSPPPPSPPSQRAPRTIRWASSPPGGYQVTLAGFDMVTSDDRLTELPRVPPHSSNVFTRYDVSNMLPSSSSSSCLGLPCRPAADAPP